MRDVQFPSKQEVYITANMDTSVFEKKITTLQPTLLPKFFDLTMNKLKVQPNSPIATTAAARSFLCRPCQRLQLIKISARTLQKKCKV